MKDILFIKYPFTIGLLFSIIVTFYFPGFIVLFEDYDNWILQYILVKLPFIASIFLKMIIVWVLLYIVNTLKVSFLAKNILGVLICIVAFIVFIP